MGWIESLYGQLVGLDTAPLIYYMEEHPSYLDLIDPLFTAVDRGDIRLVTSTLTLTEVLSLPKRNDDHRLIHLYSDLLLNSSGLMTVPVSPNIAIEVASIRAEHGLKTPDAMQLATALRSGATAFLTNDDRFARITSLQVIALDKLLR